MPQLYFQDYPGPSDKPPLILVHGLFGSGTNWRGVARRLSDSRRVLAVDMRNHGRSFHDSGMSYPEMAGDIVDTLDAQDIDKADILGHSMGGKASMVAALKNPEQVNSVIVVDIAPVIYTHTHMSLVDAMIATDPSRASSRDEVDSALKGPIEDRMIRQFLLQSLEKDGSGYRWRLNLEALKESMEELVGFPAIDKKAFEGPALFVFGGDSDYVQLEHHPSVEHFFPNAEYSGIEGAGHWVHVDQPQALVDRANRFLAA